MESDVARYLQDAVTQILMTMVIDLERFKLDPSEPYLVAERVDRLELAAREALQDLRRVVDEVRDEPSADSDLVPQVWALLGELQASTGIRGRLRIAAGWPPLLTPGTAHSLARIVEEALDKVRVRSGAAHVDVELRLEGDCLVVVVDDDGRDASAMRDVAANASSIQDMHELAIRLGGRVAVLSVSGGGTTVRAAVPRTTLSGWRRP